MVASSAIRLTSARPTGRPRFHTSTCCLPVSRMLHPWAGLIFTAAVLYMAVLWARQMRFNETDKAWWRSLREYITNHDERMPPAGRYNAGQKLLFWGFFICALLL